MAATINTNINSLNAQRNLATNASSLATSMQRLSSGLRVNSAKDDAAGLAISERMSTQLRGLTVGARNANDGISLSQTAEGALGKVGDMLQRMRELAVQASNATNSKDDRKALQAEVSQLTDEVDRMAKQTSFNGTKILDGSFAGAVFQVGANSGDVVSLGGLTNASAKGLANVAYAQANENTSVNSLATNTGTMATLASTGLDINIAGGSAASATGGFSVNVGALATANSGLERLGQVVEAVNRKTADTGVTAYLSKKDDGTYQIDLKSEKLDSAGAASTLALGASFTVATTGLDAGLTSAAAATTESTGIDTLTITTQADAWVAIKKIDSAINQVNSARASLGALQSRFESAVSNISIQMENLAASKGRIVDADFAVETSNLSRTQILQQAGTAMVAQANKLPQGVLSLLQQ
ncbi:MAG: flagellin [Ferruginibacter sp.]|nr:flagellin [Rhodoferax sp.]